MAVNWLILQDVTQTSLSSNNFREHAGNFGLAPQEITKPNSSKTDFSLKTDVSEFLTACQTLGKRHSQYKTLNIYFRLSKRVATQYCIDFQTTCSLLIFDEIPENFCCCTEVAKAKTNHCLVIFILSANVSRHWTTPN